MGLVEGKKGGEKEVRSVIVRLTAWLGAYLGPAGAGWVLRELLNDGVPQQVEAVDDGGGETQNLHTQQVDTIPNVAGPQVQGVGNTHIHVEDESADVEGHGEPTIPVDLSLQQAPH